MTGFGLAQLSLGAIVLFGAAAAAVSALCYSRLSPLISKLSPRARMPLLLVVAGLPILGGVGLTALCLMPSVLAGVWPEFDHCLEEGSAHLCFNHPPAASPNALVWGAVAILVLIGLLSAARHARSFLYALRTTSRLRKTLKYDSELGVYILPSDAPISFVSGWLKSTIFMSRGMMLGLSDEQLQAVVAHERSHVERRDTIWRTVAALLSVFHLPAVRREILWDLEVACELAADEAAVRETEDRHAVATALLSTVRLAQEQRKVHNEFNIGMGFAREALRLRIHALVEPPAYGRIPVAVHVAIAALLCVLMLPIHHTAEYVLRFLL